MTFWRNETKLIHKSKTTYYHELIEANLKGGRQLWKLIKELAHMVSPNSPTVLKCEDKCITDSQQMANYFNTFVANIAQTLTERTPTDQHSS